MLVCFTLISGHTIRKRAIEYAFKHAFEHDPSAAGWVCVGILECMMLYHTSVQQPPLSLISSPSVQVDVQWAEGECGLAVPGLDCISHDAHHLRHPLLPDGGAAVSRCVLCVWLPCHVLRAPVYLWGRRVLPLTLQHKGVQLGQCGLCHCSSVLGAPLPRPPCCWDGWNTPGQGHCALGQELGD